MIPTVQHRALGVLLVAYGDDAKFKVFGQAIFIEHGPHLSREKCDGLVAGICLDYYTTLNAEVRDSVWTEYQAIIEKLGGK